MPTSSFSSPSRFAPLALAAALALQSLTSVAHAEYVSSDPAAAPAPRESRAQRKARLREPPPVVIPETFDPSRHHRIHIQDDDPHARYEIRGAGEDVYECTGSCTIDAHEGAYHVRVVHERATIDREFFLGGATEMGGRDKQRVTAAVGYPVLGAGALLVMIGILTTPGAIGEECATTCSAQKTAENDARRSTSHVLEIVGLLGVAGGIVLVATSHGALLEIGPSRSPSGAVQVALAPVSGGAGLSLSGAF